MPKKTTTKKAAPAAVAKKPAAKKAAAPKPKRAPASTKTPAYTPDDVALRAYFISEKRRQLGVAGDSHSDWIEAERQLAAENGAKPK